MLEKAGVAREPEQVEESDVDDETGRSDEPEPHSLSPERLHAGCDVQGPSTVGGEVAVGSAIINFLGQPRVAGLPELEASKYVAIYWGGLMIGRFMGAVELSDNTCANLLLDHIGGPIALTDFWRSTGDALSRLDHNEPELNRSPPGDPHDTTTPAAMAGNLNSFIIGDVLSPASRQQLTQWMVDCKTGAKRLRGGLPANWRIGDKTGNNGKDAVGDIAMVWPKPDTPIVIAAYTQGGKPSAAQHEQVFAAIGRMVAEHLA